MSEEELSYCSYCDRYTVIDEFCSNCFKDYKKIKNELNYENKLKYFKRILYQLSVWYYIPNIENYSDGTYEFILNQIPVSKRKNYTFINQLTKQIKNDKKYLNINDQNIILEYYNYYLIFHYETKIKISNIKLINLICKIKKLNYEVYCNEKKEDINKLKKFKAFLLLIKN